MYEDYRVLFVDDEPNILNSLRRGLAEEEYYCHFAASGKEALEIIKKNKIAVIVSDMRMPEMNGLELLIRVSEESPMTVKVVLSGYTQLPQILVTINQVDIFKFVTKPWELEDLILIIRKSLDYYIMQEQNVNYKKTLEAKNKSYQNILKKINELIDDARLSKEILGLCGKAMVGFGKGFTAGEKVSFQKIFSSQETLFDILTEKVTTHKKEMKSNDVFTHISTFIKNLYPDSNIETENENPVKIRVNLKMLEAAIEALWLVFSDEFSRNGLYCRIRSSDQFTLTILSPNTEPSIPLQNTKDVRTEIDVKIELMQAVFEKALEFCQIQFRILKVKGSLAAEMTIRNTSEGDQ